MPISTYLQKHLAGQLAAHGLADRQIAPVVEDVRGRLCSLLCCWNDFPVRQALLLPGREEATFYEPTDVDLDVRSLVVVAVRNSLLENLASTREAARGLGLADQVIPDRDIPTITGAAIRFFAEVDLAQVARGPPRATGAADVFAILPRQYPTAWRAMCQLAGLAGAECDYPPVTAIAPAVAVGRALPQGWNPQFRRGQVLSGMERAIEPSLQRVLRLVLNGVVPALFADSFKMITRNPAKLFEVIELVLCNDRAVVTHNYYLRNGHVARRCPLLRPAHTAQQAREKFRDGSGLCRTHDLALRELVAYL